MNKFVENYSDHLTEDIGFRTRKAKPPEGSKLDGRRRVKNAARIRVDRIACDPQHREHFDEESIARLASSIKQHGQLQSIRVRWDQARELYVVIAGERRLRAVKQAGLQEIDCIVVEGELTDSDILTQQILENCQREDLQPVERARAFRDLMEQERWDGKRLAAELHVSEGTVSNALKLLSLDTETQERIDAGQLKPTVAINASRRSRTSSKRGRSKPPRPRTFRTPAGKVVVEPRAGKTYLQALELALAALKNESKPKAAA